MASNEVICLLVDYCCYKSDKALLEVITPRFQRITEEEQRKLKYYEPAKKRITINLLNNHLVKEYYNNPNLLDYISSFEELSVLCHAEVLNSEPFLKLYKGFIIQGFLHYLRNGETDPVILSQILKQLETSETFQQHLCKYIPNHQQKYMKTINSSREQKLSVVEECGELITKLQSPNFTKEQKEFEAFKMIQRYPFSHFLEEYKSFIRHVNSESSIPWLEKFDVNSKEGNTFENALPLIPRNNTNITSTAPPFSASPIILSPSPTPINNITIEDINVLRKNIENTNHPQSSRSVVELEDNDEEDITTPQKRRTTQTTPLNSTKVQKLETESTPISHSNYNNYSPQPGKPVLRSSSSNPYVAPPSKLMRPRKKWTTSEVEMLIEAVRKYGTAWSIISKQYDFGDRIAADLKDKYRNLFRRNLIPPFPEAQPSSSSPSPSTSLSSSSSSPSSDIIEVPESDGEDSSSSIEE